MYGLQHLGIQLLTKESCSRLVGIATDGASVNMAAHGLKGLVENELEWIFWMWCLAHRLELDALKGTSFDFIDEVLLRIYFIYEKSPKKCRELESIVNDLKEVFNFFDEGKEVRPIRACGTRWVCHKLSALKRILAKYGTYTAHLATLFEDPAVKAPDRANSRDT